MFEGTSHEIAKQKEVLIKMRAHQVGPISDVAPLPSDDLVDAIARLSTLRDRLDGSHGVAKGLADTLAGESLVDGDGSALPMVPAAFVRNIHCQIDMLFDTVSRIAAEHERIQKAVGA